MVVGIAKRQERIEACLSVKLQGFLTQRFLTQQKLHLNCTASRQYSEVALTTVVYECMHVCLPMRDQRAHPYTCNGTGVGMVTACSRTYK